MFLNTKIEVFEAINGNEAFEMVLNLKPDILITDIKMPELDGFKLSEKIKSHPELKDMPIIANSAAVMSFNKEILDEAFFDEFISKPIDFNQLLQILRKYLPYNEPETETESVGISISKLSKVNPEIIDELKKLTLSHWEKIKNKQKIDHVLKFNELVNEFGEQYQVSSLITYSKELNSAIQSFNIDKIIRLIGYYPELLNSIEQKNE